MPKHPSIPEYNASATSAISCLIGAPAPVSLGSVKTSRLWLISGIAAFLAVVIGISAAIAIANAPAPAPTASATASATPVPDPSPTASPAPSPTATNGAFEPTCETTATADFLALMTTQGWTSLDTSRDPSGVRPFDEFLDGTPDITTTCRWAADPTASTTDAIDLGWTILPAEAIADFIQRSTEAGGVMTTASEGTYLEPPGGGAYLFTEFDARWAQTRANLAYIKAPHE